MTQPNGQYRCAELRKLGEERETYEKVHGPIDEEKLTALASGSAVEEHEEKVAAKERSKVTDKGVIALAENCKLLSEVYLENCHVTDKGVIALAETCKLLSKVNLQWCEVTDEGIKALAHNCQSLSNVSLAQTKVTYGMMQTLRAKGIKVYD